MGAKPPSARMRMAVSAIPARLANSSRHLPPHHPPHLGRHVVAELPFDRVSPGLLDTRGRAPPCSDGGQGGRAASLGQKHRLGRPPGVQVRGPGLP